MGSQRVRHESERPSLSLSKESMEEEDIMFTNIHVPNIETHEYIKQILIDKKGKLTILH